MADNYKPIDFDSEEAIDFDSEEAIDFDSEEALDLDSEEDIDFDSEEAIMELVLLNKGADANAQRELYTDALWTASCRGHEAIVKLLLSINKDGVDRKDSSGKTALRYAEEGGHQRIVELLRKHLGQH